MNTLLKALLVLCLWLDGGNSQQHPPIGLPRDPMEFMNRCCEEGRDVPEEEKCAPNYKPKGPEVNVHFDQQCFNTFFQCCSALKANRFCREGHEMSQNGTDCGLKPKTELIASELVEECCNACNEGRKGATPDFACDEAANFRKDAGSFWKNTFNECCLQAKPPREEGEELIPQERSDNNEQPKDLRAIDAKHTEKEDICSLCEHDCGAKEDGSKACTCPIGLELEDDGHRCRDIDECSLVDTCNAQTESCVNYYQGHECIPLSEATDFGDEEDFEGDDCGFGFRFDFNQQECADINECVELLSPCKKRHEVCTNTEGSYLCSPAKDSNCTEGYEPDPKDPETCLDINECQQDESPCDEKEEDCINYEGGSYCVPKEENRPNEGNTHLLGMAQPEKTEGRHKNRSAPDHDDQENEIKDEGEKVKEADNFDDDFFDCDSGFVLNTTTNVCEDVDECKEGTAFCWEEQICVNNNGSYTCEDIHCEVGYKPLDNGTCALVTCKKGFRYDSVWGECKDIDECLYLDGEDPPCLETEICKNTDGNYTCEQNDCKPGHKKSSFFGGCVDIDECEANETLCGVNETCKNMLGSYECDCTKGYAKKEKDGECEDIDECNHDTWSPCKSMGSFCENYNGSFACICRIGFKEYVKGECDDIDECAEEPNTCHPPFFCKNTFGGHECNCPFGQQVAADNKTCETALEDMPYCHGIRSQKDGKEFCSCPFGFRLENNSTCHDVNECKEGPNPCKDLDTVCVNVYGSHQCANVACPDDYTRDPEKNVCFNKHFNSKACEDDNTKCRKHYEEPVTIGYYWVSMLANISTHYFDKPTPIFTIHGLDKTPHIYHFLVKEVNVTASNGVKRADLDKDFQMERTGNPGITKNIGVLFLRQPLEGPQQVELSIDVLVENREDLKILHKSIVYIFVSEYDGEVASFEKQ